MASGMVKVRAQPRKVAPKARQIPRIRFEVPGMHQRHCQQRALIAISGRLKFASIGGHPSRGQPAQPSQSSTAGANRVGSFWTTGYTDTSRYPAEEGHHPEACSIRATAPTSAGRLVRRPVEQYAGQIYVAHNHNEQVEKTCHAATELQQARLHQQRLASSAISPAGAQRPPGVLPTCSIFNGTL